MDKAKQLERFKRNRNFLGLWFPIEIYLNEELNWVEKILLIEIQSLDNENGCFASNAYFAAFLKRSEWTISQAISTLKKLGYIQAVSFNGRQRVLKCLLVTQCQPLEKPKGSLLENPIHNNTININKEREGLPHLFIKNNNLEMDLKKALEEFNNSPEFINLTAKNNGLKKETVKGQIEIFLKTHEATENTYSNISEFKNHFKNWIPYQDLNDEDKTLEAVWFITMFNDISGRNFKLTKEVRRLFTIQLKNRFTDQEFARAVKVMYSPHNKFHKSKNYELATPVHLLTGDNLNNYLNTNI